MTTDIKFSYWKDGQHILVSTITGDCFLNNAALNPLINWLNLFRSDIESGKPCEGNDKINDVYYSSVGSNLLIKTHRDVVWLNASQLTGFITWLKKHKKTLSIHEVWQ